MMHQLESAVLGYTTLRLAIGMSMLIHGVARIGNVSGFANALSTQFAKTWLPEVAVVAFAYATPPVELAIGALILTGLFTRAALTAAGLWMVLLIFGSTLVQQYDVVGIQLLYALIFSLLLRDERWNEWSADRLLRAQGKLPDDPTAPRIRKG